MADNDPVAKARAIAARLAAVVPDMSVLGKRKSRWEEDPLSMMDGKKRKKVYIPVEKYPDINFLGLLIGPRGSNQKRMETLSGARILIRGKGASKELTGAPDENEDLHVLIAGDTDEQIARAQHEVEDILFNPEKAMKLKQEQLRQVAENSNSYDGHYGPGGGDDHSTLNIPVPRNLVGLIIGKGGETIRELQGKSGCHIQVARETEMNSEATERTVMCSGSPAQLEMAKQLINDLLSDRMHGGQFIGSGESMKMPVPNDKVGLIIGRQGATVKGVQQRTGASIVIPPAADSDNPGFRTLIVSGSHEAREKARIEINMLINDQHQLIPTGAHTIYMQIPNERVGIVIGRGGATVKAIQDRTNVKIQIPNSIDPGSIPEVRTICISGPTMESIAMAKAEVDAILLEDTGGRNSRYSSHYGDSSQYGYDTSAYDQQYAQQYQYTYEQYQAYYQQAGLNPDGTPATAADGTTAAATPAEGDGTAAAATTADPNDPNAYWNGYYEYAAYYGVDAANAAWGVTTAEGAPAADANAAPTEGEADKTKESEKKDDKV
ncbi:hypothetical protein Ae201684P_005879 [Aphanomyces euteiches]|uniref:K Homology domain-containing protein n=1 Tax=Aphanomyces euteiches TaxID=100861 RepID=A0A6G0WVZ7_9STRA|nr:hypothetical protein Ae201684_011035 [Aphanomyces euteiches]KAH9058536.1 hypothetical protein Ae201684P_005879 [Aphanomyces euteiches]KAH9132824.1 hypothetical protein AeRB84_020888 [Aphanomyces euteiches]